MPKIKTHKGAAKRFKITGSGKILRVKAYKGHILTKKSAERKRRLGKMRELSASDKKKVRRLLARWGKVWFKWPELKEVRSKEENIKKY